MGFARSCLALVVERESMEKRTNEWKNRPAERVADGRSTNVRGPVKVGVHRNEPGHAP